MEEILLNKLHDEEWHDLKQIVVYGYGRQGKKVIQKLKKDFEIIAIVESDKKKCGKTVEGIKIMHFEEARQFLKNYKTIVAVIEKYYMEISQQLVKLGLKEYTDFVKAEDFIAEWYSKFRNQICIMKTDLFLTSYCSLKCQNCMVYIPYWKKHVNMELDNIKVTLDNFFKCIDYVFSMDMSGGEAFLYPDLVQLIRYIDENYRDRIGYLGLVTNGTIVPNEEILAALEKYRIGVSISDYAGVPDYNSKADELCELLEQRGISYIRNQNMIWMEQGFPSHPCQFDDTTVIAHRKQCRASNHLICDSKFFYCSSVHGACMGGLVAMSKDDYIDLKEINEESLDERKKILKYSLGELRRTNEYEGFCNLCGGVGADNTNIVIAGVQMK